MRIILISVFILLGANLMIEMLDSNMIEILEERKESIESITQYEQRERRKKPVLKLYPKSRKPVDSRHRSAMIQTTRKPTPTPMKIILIAIIGFMAWQSPEIRTATADVLESTADVIRPETQNRFVIQF